jgi:protein-L-isoaspartate(D-aspartate) O-methyltransferase
MESDIDRQLQSMIVHQLRARGITSARVLAAMREIPRHEFVPEPLQEAAYEDRALPIDCEQTISQPYIVGLMTQALELTGTERVLEIGTGSGYQTAVLSRLAAEVFSIERHEELSRQAQEVLRGWPEEAPFERIIVTAAAAHCPDDLLAQLADPGRLVIPIGPPQQQNLVAIVRHGGKDYTFSLCPCRFVPLIEDH